MSRVCTICSHPQLHAINKALVSGTSFRDIAGQFGVSKSAVERHQAEHLPKVLTKAAEAEEVRQALDVLQQLKAINGAALRVLRDAQSAGDGELTLKSVDRVMKQIELQAKLLGDLDERPQIVLVQSPEWLALRTRLVAVLRPYPEAAHAVVEALDAG